MILLFPEVEVTRLLSNLIKGYSTQNSGPFIIDADKSEIAIKINEQVMQEYEQFAESTDSSGFVSGLSAAELTAEELEHRKDVLQDSSNELSDSSELEEDIELAHQAALVVEEAYEEAKEIRAKALAEAEDIKAQSRLIGKEEGYQQGLADAAAEIACMKEQLMQEQEQFKAELLAEQDACLEKLEPRFADVLCQLLTRLTGVVVKGHREVILYLINNAMRGIENSHSFVISLSEADFEYVNKHKKEIYGYLNPGVKIELFQDSKLTKNQCKIETDSGLVDLSLDVQISQLIKSLMLLNS